MHKYKYTKIQNYKYRNTHLKATSSLLLLPSLLHSLLLVPEGAGGRNKQTKEQLEILLFRILQTVFVVKLLYFLKILQTVFVVKLQYYSRMSYWEGTKTHGW